jgi:hypothetical protein
VISKWHHLFSNKRAPNAIKEHQIAIAHLAIKKRKITSNYLATKEHQMVAII